MAVKSVPLSRSGAHIRVSFEFFPPKTAEMEANLWEAATRLEPLNPSFVSVTYGAGGSTRERTHATVPRFVRETTLKPAAHLTCVGASKDEIRRTLRAYHGAGVRHIVALRGDPPAGFDAPYAPRRRLSDDRRPCRRSRQGDFEVSVAAYPEKHPQSPTLLHDIDLLKRKVDAGATARSPSSSSTTPSISAFSTSPRRPASRSRSCPASCRCRISSRPPISPDAPAPACRNGSPTVRRARGRSRDPPPRRRRRLRRTGRRPIDRGVEELHFYTMNRADLVFAICHLVGLRAQPKLAVAAA